MKVTWAGKTGIKKFRKIKKGMCGMNEIKIFENPEFGSVRTIQINGEPWFVGKNVSDILGYQNGS